MKKSRICLALIILSGMIAFVVPALTELPDIFRNWGLFTAFIAILILAAFFFEFEDAAVSSKEVALVAMLGTIAAVLRVPFAAIPSVQPCTSLIICAGYVFGPVAGFMVGAITALLSNFFLGQGPWTPYQMLAWGLAGASAAYAGKLKFGRIGLVVFGVVWGYLYGWLMNTWFWVSFTYPLTLRTFLVTQLTSILFDTLHAAGNAVFLWIFGLKTITILERFKKRFNWSFTGKAD